MAEGNVLIEKSSITQLSTENSKSCDNPEGECGFGGFIGLVGNFDPLNSKAESNNIQVNINESYVKGRIASKKIPAA
ncbi:MAG TPA: hypothetical protein VI522_00885 [Gammaproteobacteria bacterium]|nr:hypothetical protein [Gammaproteobacteria bacterium]